MSQEDSGRPVPVKNSNTVRCEQVLAAETVGRALFTIDNPLYNLAVIRLHLLIFISI